MTKLFKRSPAMKLVNLRVIALDPLADGAMLYIQAAVLE